MVVTRRGTSDGASAAADTTAPPRASEDGPPTASTAAQYASASSIDVVAASDGAATAAPALEKRPRKRITAEAKAELLKHFALAKYNRNDKMPRRNTDKALDGILDMYGLTRGQGSRQLAQYRLGKKLKVKKIRRYKESQLKDIFTVFSDRDEIVEFLDILTCDDKITNGAAYADYLSPNELVIADHLRLSKGGVNDVVRGLAADAECPFADVLLEVTDFYADTAAEVFPAVSKSLRHNQSLVIPFDLSKSAQFVVGELFILDDSGKRSFRVQCFCSRNNMRRCSQPLQSHHRRIAIGASLGFAAACLASAGWSN
mmetsp:Transcript_4502/g.7692  ORF Transcript_4502/g.7692 Transcript_4502/m.7692 type:complete len:315 (-) Transcript_4502:44-988(-)